MTTVTFPKTVIYGIKRYSWKQRPDEKKMWSEKIMVRIRTSVVVWKKKWCGVPSLRSLPTKDETSNTNVQNFYWLYVIWPTIICPRTKCRKNDCKWHITPFIQHLHAVSFYLLFFLALSLNMSSYSRWDTWFNFELVRFREFLVVFTFSSLVVNPV